MQSRLIQKLLSIAKNCSKNGYIISTHADIIFIKEEYNLTDLELCNILEHMKYKGLLREFNVQYSGNGTLYRYWFK